MFDFIITSKKSKARTGVLTTPHGAVETPVFMPVGTFGAVKTLAPWELENLDSRIILGNTYHLYLRPGDDIIAQLGGLHQFINWSGPILTDSGGFQIYSIGKRQAIDEEGIKFRSTIDGSEQRFTPEKSIQIQKNLGADIIMAFDDVVGISRGRQELMIAMKRTHRWLLRSINSYSSYKTQALFGIVQGGYEEDLRQKSAEFVASQNLAGNAIGGLAMPGDLTANSQQPTANYNKNQMWQTVNQVCQILPENKPRYLMGVGEPADLVRAINLGCDMFDCVLPTRLARHGTVWVWNSSNLTNKTNFNWTNYSRVNLLNAKFKADPRPLDESCLCQACQGFSRAYLRHLLVCGEVLGIRLLSMHNIWFINQLIERIKAEIRK